MSSQKPQKGAPNKITYRARSRKPHHDRYKMQGRKMRNKVKKLRRHCKRLPGDAAAIEALDTLSKRAAVRGVA